MNKTKQPLMRDMTLRDYAAIEIMKANVITGEKYTGDFSLESVALDCVEIADKLIEALNYGI